LFVVGRRVQPCQKLSLMSALKRGYVFPIETGGGESFGRGGGNLTA